MDGGDQLQTSAMRSRDWGKTIQSWRLFWLLALGISAAVCQALPLTDFHSAPGMEYVILRSVRCALPLFLLAFTASSLAILWPSGTTRWLLSNRRYFGLAFAFGMAWHLSFVGYTELSFGINLRALPLTADLVGFMFLIAMTLTSFRWSARRLGPANWRRLHKAGAYAIWLLTLYIYQGGARSHQDLFHFATLGVLLAAGGVRVAAWLAK
jgi:DMSO/TMAO reductase YedYZ heme-binding membrane subunit